MTTFNLNGRSVDVTDVPDDTSLLWILRDTLALPGTKFGCGRGLCGACTVHVNDLSVRSCITPLSAVAGQRVTTIEGLGGAEGLHPLQQAWIDEQVPQCGYCQSGQLMQAAALLHRNAHPSDEEIVSAMNGNLCRCGTYPRIRRAIHRVAAKREGGGT